MIEANELRIGNYVEGYYKVLAIDFRADDCYLIDMNQDTTTEYYQTLGRCKPIPLTEEWLLKFGFRVAGKIAKLYTNDRVFSLYEYTYKAHEYPTECKHVHQLQNLYFALTGEELTI